MSASYNINVEDDRLVQRVLIVATLLSLAIDGWQMVVGFSVTNTIFIDVETCHTLCLGRVNSWEPARCECMDREDES